jgi:hypothetical protein
MRDVIGNLGITYTQTVSLMNVSYFLKSGR